MKSAVINAARIPVADRQPRRLLLHSRSSLLQESSVVQRRADMDKGRDEQRHSDRDMDRMPERHQAARLLESLLRKRPFDLKPIHRARDAGEDIAPDETADNDDDRKERCDTRQPIEFPGSSEARPYRDRPGP